MSNMGYRFLDHVTDAIVEVDAVTLQDAFVDAAYATTDLTLDRQTVKETDVIEFVASGENLRYLLFSWLEEVVFVLITEAFAIRRVDLQIIRPNKHETKSYTIIAKAYGEPLDLTRHKFRVEIKAPTFYDMEIKENDTMSDGVYMRFLLDL